MMWSITSRADRHCVSWLTDALRVLAHREPVYAYDFEGIRYDVGDKLGFLKATVEYALRRPDLGLSFKEYLQGLTVEE